MIPTLKLLRYELVNEQVPKDIAERIVNGSVQEASSLRPAAKCSSVPTSTT
jgi:hypothetical protein